MVKQSYAKCVTWVKTELSLLFKTIASEAVPLEDFGYIQPKLIYN